MTADTTHGGAAPYPAQPHPANTAGHSGAEEPAEGPVIRDKRRIDPVTGALRDQAGAPGPAAMAGSAEAAAGAPAAPAVAPSAPPAPAPSELAGGDLDALHRQLAERTADLQRLSAEYANYRRRVDRDREMVRDFAVVNVVANLLPVLDDIGRARDHGELEGGFKAVAESLEAIVGKLGLERYGEEGEPFDPTVHEALMHGHSPDVTEPTCTQILQPGYRIGERILRPARVAVADPDA